MHWVLGQNFHTLSGAMFQFLQHASFSETKTFVNSDLHVESIFFFFFTDFPALRNESNLTIIDINCC